MVIKLINLSETNVGFNIERGLRLIRININLQTIDANNFHIQNINLNKKIKLLKIKRQELLINKRRGLIIFGKLKIINNNIKTNNNKIKNNKIVIINKNRNNKLEKAFNIIPMKIINSKITKKVSFNPEDFSGEKFNIKSDGTIKRKR